MHILTFVYTNTQYSDTRRSVGNLLEFNNQPNRFRLRGTPSVLASRQCAQQTFTCAIASLLPFPPAPPLIYLYLSPSGLPRLSFVFSLYQPCSASTRVRLPARFSRGGWCYGIGFLRFLASVFTCSFALFLDCIYLVLSAFILPYLLITSSPSGVVGASSPSPAAEAAHLSPFCIGLADIFSPLLLVR